MKWVTEVMMMNVKKKLLLVDDEVFMLDLLNHIFSKEYELHLASNGSEALEILNQFPDIELIISDMDMPITSGTELINTIRGEVSVNQKVPIVLISSNRSEEVEALIQGNQIDAFYQKPFSSDEICKKVRMLL